MFLELPFLRWRFAGKFQSVRRICGTSEIGWRARAASIHAADHRSSRKELRAMASAYYSTIFHEPAAEIWKIIRDFNNYPIWVGGAGESRIEDGKSGDAVGAVRHVLYQGRQIRQRLLALSDVERAQTL
jgi:hypothetical protein